MSKRKRSEIPVVSVDNTLGEFLEEKGYFIEQFTDYDTNNLINVMYINNMELPSEYLVDAINKNLTIKQIIEMYISRPSTRQQPKTEASIEVIARQKKIKKSSGSDSKKSDPKLFTEKAKTLKFNFTNLSNFMNFISKQFVFDKLHDNIKQRFYNQNGTLKDKVYTRSDQVLLKQLLDMRKKMIDPLVPIMSIFFNDANTSREDKINTLMFLIDVFPREFVISVTPGQNVSRSRENVEKIFENIRQDNEFLQRFTQNIIQNNQLSCVDMEARVSAYDTRRVLEYKGTNKKLEVTDNMGTLQKITTGIKNFFVSNAGSSTIYQEGESIYNPLMTMDGSNTRLNLETDFLIPLGPTTFDFTYNENYYFRVRVVPSAPNSSTVNISIDLSIDNNKQFVTYNNIDLGSKDSSVSMVDAFNLFVKQVQEPTFKNQAVDLMQKSLGDFFMNMTFYQAMTDEKVDDDTNIYLFATDRLSNAIATELLMDTDSDVSKPNSVHIVNDVKGYISQVVAGKSINNLKFNQVVPQQYYSNLNHLYTLHLSPEDGNCLFSSMSNIWNSINPDNPTDARGIRQMIVNYETNLANIAGYDVQARIGTALVSAIQDGTEQEINLLINTIRNVSRSGRQMLRGISDVNREMLGNIYTTLLNNSPQDLINIYDGYMSQQGVWGSQLEIQALSSIMRIPINIYNDTYTTIISGEDLSNVQTINGLQDGVSNTILYYRDGRHYDILVKNIVNDGDEMYEDNITNLRGGRVQPNPLLKMLHDTDIQYDIPYNIDMNKITNVYSMLNIDTDNLSNQHNDNFKSFLSFIKTINVSKIPSQTVILNQYNKKYYFATSTLNYVLFINNLVDDLSGGKKLITRKTKKYKKYKNFNSKKRNLKKYNNKRRYTKKRNYKKKKTKKH